MTCILAFMGCSKAARKQPLPGAPNDAVGGEAWAGSVPDSVEDEILEALENYYADFSARDWEAFASHFWPGATITTIWAPPGESAPRVVAQTIPDFIAKAPEGPGSKPIFEERMDDARVRAHGNLAQVWAAYTARFGEPGNVLVWKGIDAFSLLKHEDRWRITSLTFAGD
jgi:hypothetical protein